MFDIKQKWSTFSNIFYIIVGVLLVAVGDPPVMVSLAGLWVAFLGIASAGYHATESKAWQRLDVGAIYGSFWTIAYALLSLIGPDAPELILILVSLASGLLMMAWKTDFNSLKTVPLIYGLLFVLMIVHYDGARAWIATGLLVLGSACQFVGERLRPEVADRFHAGWHVFTAAGIYLMLA